MRRAKLEAIVLGDDLDNLNQQLYEEAERVDAAQTEAHTWQEEAADASARVERTMNELRARTRELETLKVRLYHNAQAGCTDIAP